MRLVMLALACALFAPREARACATAPVCSLAPGSTVQLRRQMLPDRDVLTIDLGAGPAPMAQVLVTRGTVVDEYEIGSYHADGSFTTDNAETIHLRRLHATDTIEVRLANCHTDRVLGRFTVADIPVEQGDVPWTILGAMLALVILALRSLRTPALGVMLPTARVRSCR